MTHNNLSSWMRFKKKSMNELVKPSEDICEEVGGCCYWSAQISTQLNWAAAAVKSTQEVPLFPHSRGTEAENPEGLRCLDPPDSNLPHLPPHKHTHGTLWILLEPKAPVCFSYIQSWAELSWTKPGRDLIIAPICSHRRVRHSLQKLMRVCEIIGKGTCCQTWWWMQGTSFHKLFSDFYMQAF